MKPLDDIKAYCNDPKNRSTVNVGLFIVLIISFHFLFLVWQKLLGYWPVTDAVDQLMLWSVNLVYRQSCWVLDEVLHIDIVTIGSKRLIAALNNEGGWAIVTIATECASLKQWMHWLFLMLLFPGPWKHKLWYIPAGLVIIEWTNVVRICGILLLQIPFPNSFHIAHDYIFKIFFYLVIFLMWMLWVEKFYNPSIQAKQNKSKQHE